MFGKFPQTSDKLPSIVLSYFIYFLFCFCFVSDMFSEGKVQSALICLHDDLILWGRLRLGLF